MSDLIDRARLTDEEIIGILDRYTIAGDDEDEDEALGRAVADAAMTKALRVVCEWLDEQRRIGQAPSPETLALYRELHEGRDQVGIPRPTVQATT